MSADNNNIVGAVTIQREDGTGDPYRCYEVRPPQPDPQSDEFVGTRLMCRHAMTGEIIEIELTSKVVAALIAVTNAQRGA